MKRSHTIQSPNTFRITRCRMAVLMALYGAALPTYAQLPVQCAAGCGPGVWVTSGAAVHATTGDTMTIQQHTPRAVLNWQSFNIGKDSAVEFKQPSSDAIAINRVFGQTDPSMILGKLTANGQIYVLNQNGIVFGSSAQVNVNSLIASTLNISDIALQNGILSAISEKQAAFLATEGIPSGEISIARGAKLTAASGGSILVFAPRITNEGTITTPDGQTMLAAGNKIYLMASGDSSKVRGLLVEVDVDDVSDETLRAYLKGEITQLPAGTVSNNGEINAAHGNVTLMGLAVNQNGRVSANTSVRANGSVFLLARDRVNFESATKFNVDAITAVSDSPVPTRGGAVRFEANSVTAVTPDLSDTQSMVDSTAQPLSTIRVTGQQVQLRAGSHITATSGNVSINARSNPSILNPTSAQADASRVLIEAGAVIDVSGAHIELPMERNVAQVELRGDQLKDSPFQRDGSLRNKKINVDVRVSGVHADGTPWQGTPLADASGTLAAVNRKVDERSLTGGSIDIDSQGDVIVAANAMLDVSGGSIQYKDGYINTTKLIAGGRLYDIGQAPPELDYIIADSYTVTSQKWGVSKTWQLLPGGDRGYFAAGYVEGKDAGAVTLLGPRIIADGFFRGEAIRGPLQRKPTIAIAEASRAHDQAPLGGLLIIGQIPVPGGPIPDYRAPTTLLFTRERDLRINPSDTEDLPLQLVADIFGPEGMSRAKIFANNINVPNDVDVVLPAGGSLELIADTMDVKGAIQVPAGKISLSAESIGVGSTAKISVAGLWVNDQLATDSLVLAPTYIHGGKVSFSAVGGNIRVEAGSEIDASSGGWLGIRGSLRKGDGGTIAFSVTRTNVQTGEETPQLILDGALEAYGLRKGGTLKLAADSILIADRAGDSTDQSPGDLWLSPQRFQQGGFNHYEISTTDGALTVADNTIIQPRAERYTLNQGFALEHSGVGVRHFARPELLSEMDRQPTHLTLKVAQFKNDEYEKSNFADAGVLTIGDGARIEADPLANINLSADSRIYVGGSISAPAGSVSLTLNSDLTLKQFIPSQNIWLADTSSLSANGAPSIRPTPQGRLPGEILPGGTIDVNAQRGFVIVEQGAQLDVSAAQAQLDVPTAQGDVKRVTVNGDAGKIRVSAAEGLFLAGELLGHAAAGSRGGSLVVALDASQRKPFDSFKFISDTRVLTLSAAPTDVPASWSPDAVADDVVAAFAGRGFVQVGTIAEGGFDTIELKSASIREHSIVESLGTVAFEGDVSLLANRGITINAPQLLSDGGIVQLRAPYIALGSQNSESDRVDDPLETVSAGSGQFNATADFLDLIGVMRLDGFGEATLRSSGDLRLRGFADLYNLDKLQGEWRSAGVLNLDAAQIYPTTLTNFSINSVDIAPTAERAESLGQINITNSQGATSAPVLSAGGKLNIEASHINHDGVLKAPFGEIELIAKKINTNPEPLPGEVTEVSQQLGQLVLGSNSLTSTSAEGATIPFGTVQAGLGWVYTMDNKIVAIDPKAGTLPQQSIRLEAPDVAVNEGARIDLRGGGELLGDEFIPGVDGTRDILGNRSGNFAVIPALASAYAPHDSQQYNGSTLSPGDSITFNTDLPGLPAGTYALLPPRYALLPGAFLVTPIKGFRDTEAGQHFDLAGTSGVIGGRYSFAQTGIGDARSQGFAIRSNAELNRFARYDTATASAFFSVDDTAAKLARMPQDAGHLVLAAEQALTFQGSLFGDAAPGGRGAEVDIAATHIAFVGANPSAQVGADAVQINASLLNNISAESILIGGTRHRNGVDTTIEVTAQTVYVDTGVTLQAPTLLLSARDSITVANGATVASKGSAASEETLKLSGDAALLRVSAGKQADLTHTDEQGLLGNLNINEGAVIVASGAMLFDVSGNMQLDGDVQIQNGALAVRAGRIALGGDAQPVLGTVALDTNMLQQSNLSELLLISRSSVDIAQDLQFGAAKVVIDAAGVRGKQGAQQATITADTLELRNAKDVVDSELADGNGQLQLTTQNLIFDEGDFALSGFSQVSIEAAKQVVNKDEGKNIVSGALTINTPRITSDSGATRKLDVGEALTITAPLSTAALPGVETLGGRFDIEAASILHSGRIDMPAGIVSMTANGDAATDSVVLAANSVINASGASVLFDDQPVFAPGGRIKLESLHGNVAVQGSGASAAVVDVSAVALGGNAGRITLAAPEGEVLISGDLRGNASDGYQSGSANVDTATLNSFSDLNTTLNQGGFSHERAIRVRRGDVIIAVADDVRSSRFSLAVDGAVVGGVPVEPGGEGVVAVNAVPAPGGNLDVQGTISASSAKGGAVHLAARGNLTVHGTAKIDAHATEQGNERGGRVSLSTGEGTITLAQGAQIDVSAADGSELGKIQLRAPRTDSDGDSVMDDVAIAPIASTIKGAKVVIAEALAVYEGVSTITVNDINTWQAETQTYMQNAPTSEARLGKSNGLLSQLHVQPGIEVRNEGDITLAADWDFASTNAPAVLPEVPVTDGSTDGSAQVPDVIGPAPENLWRYGAAQVPGTLTLRATGNLTIGTTRGTKRAGSLSDGFESATSSKLLGGDSWSYRLIAGADVSSANVLAVQAPRLFSAETGVSADFTLAQGKPIAKRVVRTGNGEIDIAAAGNVILGNQSSVIYTAGVPAGGVALDDFRIPATLYYRPYSDNGGDITLTAGNSVDGAVTDQLISAWLLRAGGGNKSSAVGWLVDFANFSDNIGALGGGDITVMAEQDIRNLSLAIPSIGRQDGGATLAQSKVTVVGGGDLSVEAGNDILSSRFYVGKGKGTLTAGGDMAAAPFDENTVNTPLNTLLALGDAQLDLWARGDVVVDSVGNPTTFPRRPPGNQAVHQALFFTYAPDTALSINSLGGDIVLKHDVDAIPVNVFVRDVVYKLMFTTYPARVRAASLQGDIIVGNLESQTQAPMFIFPHEKGNLELFAKQNVLIGEGSLIVVSDADQRALATVELPRSNWDEVSSRLSPYIAVSNNIHASTPVHGVADREPIRVIANTGDIQLKGTDGQSKFILAKQAHFIAGRDIINLQFDGQNVDKRDVTLVAAGRDVVYTGSRYQDGLPQNNDRGINLDGPGRLEVRAGRDVILGTSVGLVAQGNVSNPALPENGADIYVLPGVGAQLAFDSFIQHYLVDTSTHQVSVRDYMRSFTDNASLSTEDALTQFLALSEQDQTTWVFKMLFSEMRESGRAAAASGSGDFSRGFVAIKTLFPDAPEHQGDLNMFMSKIATFDNSSIFLLVPSGEVNAGLATAPVSLGAKPPSALGIVVQQSGDVTVLSKGDFLVNESRVFTADGGNILLWSSEGDIDAGRGSKTAISSPPPTLTIDAQGKSTIVFPPTLEGSGIRAFVTTPGKKPGDVDLYAPSGVVNAGDAGIGSAGNVTVAAVQVIGADNIDVGGVAVGVPVIDTGSLAAGLTGLSNLASDATKDVESSLNSNLDNAANSATPLADDALSFLEVVVEGFGE